VDARERKIGDPLSGVDVEHGSGCSVLGTHLANGEEQEYRAVDQVFHSRRCLHCQRADASD